MAQLVKCSLHTHGELSADLQHVELHVRHQQWLQSRNWVRRERQIRGAHGAASLAEWRSSGSVKEPVSENKVDSD